MGQNWIADNGEFALTFENPVKVPLCSNQKSTMKLILSDQGIAVSTIGKLRRKRERKLIKQSTILDSLPHKSKHELENPGFVMTDQLAAELQAIVMKERENLKFSFNHLMLSTCHQMRDTLEILKALIRSSPTLAVRSILKTHYVTARATMGLVEVDYCQPIPIEDSTFHAMKAEQCTEYPPAIFIVGGKNVSDTWILLLT